LSGKFLVIEGIDGSGKNTQTKLLYDYCLNKEIDAKIIQFPAYEATFFGHEVGRFLDGKYGSLVQVHPKLAAILYAGDRYEMREQILKYISNNELLICDRYVSSNIAHQASKYCDPNDRMRFSSWVERLEYSVFSMPKPDVIVFLDLPPRYSRKLVLNKKPRVYTNKQEDIQEGNLDYLREVYSIYKELSSGEEWRSIKCYNEADGRIRTIQEISIDVIAVIKDLGF